ncbi:MAG TPA: M48 family metallopeptidase [Blastocatellia bacterium]|nr:M48 family metallopeptidase [Blastocatellia bacterium]
MRSLILLISSIAVLFVVFGAAQPGASRAPTSPREQTSQRAAREIQKQEVKTYTLPPEKYEKAVTYSKMRYWLHFIGVGYALLLLFVILSVRVAPKFRDVAERTSRRRFVQAIVFVPLLLLTFDGLQLPLAAYGQHLAVNYDISVQGWGSWLWDWTKGELVQFIIASILVYILYGVIRRSPRRWWLYFGIASVPILIFLLFISPLVIDPLFNRFEPLQDSQPALVAEIERVMQHGGLDIPRERMFEMKASEKVNALDAYVTGFAGSKRVVVWDTTIAQMTTPQTVFVVGHEAGHYMLGHIPKAIAFFTVLIIVVLFLVHLSLRRALEKRHRKWNVRGLDDWASLPALLLFTYLFFFLAEPGFNTFSRYQEHQADVYGLEVIHGIVPNSSETAAEAFQVLGEVDLADPAPSTLIKVWLYSHPPLGERIVFAREYDPWSTGREPMFVR